MIIELVSYSYSSNSYILTGDYNILIDPGLPNNEALKTFMHRNPTNIDAIINTHCHYDHIGSNFGKEIMVHENDSKDVENGTDKTVYRSFVSEFKGFNVSRVLRDGDTIENGEHKLEVIHTPGHTSGSISLLDKDNDTLFSGDTWFNNGVGRTDLPSGSYEELKESFRKLRDVDVTHVCPGHGTSFCNNINQIIANYFIGV